MSEERASANIRRRRRLLVSLGAEQDHLCFYCGKRLIYPDPSKRYENHERNAPDVPSFDHVIPQSKNGRHGSNLVIAHRQCNSDRDITPLTLEQTEKLNRLNERRQHLFGKDAGRTSPETFGIITLSSIVLAEKVDDIQTGHHMRGRICKFVQRYSKFMRSLSQVKDADDWQYMSALILQDRLAQLGHSSFLHKTYIASVLKAIRQDHMQKRYNLTDLQKHEYNPNDYDDGLD